MFLVLCVAMLPACSALKLGYNALPDFAYWWLDGYADFTDEQAPRVHQELARLHAWHRTTELPRLAEIIGKMEQLAPGPVTPQQACGFVAEAQARLLSVADQGEAAAGAVAATFTARQLRHLERKFGKKNAEWRTDWIEIPATERFVKRQKQFADRLESLYGPMEEPQLAVLRRAIAQSIFDPARGLSEWQRRQSDLLQVLRQAQERGGDAAFAAAGLRGWRDRGLRSPDSGYRKYQQDLLEENCRMFAAVHESTSAEQRTRAARRLKAWQRDLRELSAAG
jgi:hypothetical protein